MSERQILEEILSTRKSELKRYINSLLNKRLREQIAADDILAEAVRYLLDHPRVSQSRSSEHLFRFLLWKCRHLIIDRHRTLATEEAGMKRNRERLSGNDDLLERPAPSPSFLLHRAEKYFSLRRCIEMLPNEDRRAALRLVRIEGHSLEEASRILGKTPEAVKKLVQRGFQDLVEKLRCHQSWKFATSGVTT